MQNIARIASEIRTVSIAMAKVSKRISLDFSKVEDIMHIGDSHDTASHSARRHQF